MLKPEVEFQWAANDEVQCKMCSVLVSTCNGGSSYDVLHQLSCTSTESTDIVCHVHTCEQIQYSQLNNGSFSILLSKHYQKFIQRNVQVLQFLHTEYNQYHQAQNDDDDVINWLHQSVNIKV